MLALRVGDDGSERGSFVLDRPSSRAHAILPLPDGGALVGEPEPDARLAGVACPECGERDVNWLNVEDVGVRAHCDRCGADFELSREEICKMLSKMCYTAQPSTSDSDKIDVQIPITRADVLHQADIMEDVAIGYSFNNLPRNFPSTSSSVAAALPINKLADIVRVESAMAGWSEVMPLILCSHDENYAWLNKADDGKAVRLQNPKALEYQIVRTSLIPGLLKTLRENKRHAVPMKIFEVSDIGLQDPSLERKSRNERHFAAAWYGKSSGFEHVHGLLDRVMLMLRSAFITREDGLKNSKLQGYFIEELNGMKTHLLSSLSGENLLT